MWDTGILNCDCDVDIFCLHFVFSQPKNQVLDLFKYAWNNHKLSSEGNFTPQQLYVRWMLKRFGSDKPAIRDVFHIEFIDETLFGVDFKGPIPKNQTNNNIQVRCFLISFKTLQSHLEKIILISQNTTTFDTPVLL